MLRKLGITVKPDHFISQIEFDVEDGEMRITYKTGKVFTASGVDPAIATELETPGASVGGIFHSKLRGQYAWTEAG